jgi:hypothetical protein
MSFVPCCCVVFRAALCAVEACNKPLTGGQHRCKASTTGQLVCTVNSIYRETGASRGMSAGIIRQQRYDTSQHAAWSLKGSDQRLKQRAKW